VTTKTAENTVPAAEELLEVVREVESELHPGRKGRRGVTLDSSLERDLGLDSLGRVELLLRLEKRFGVHLPEQILPTVETPRDLLRALESRHAAGGPAAHREPTARPGRERPGESEELPGEGEPAPESARSLVEVVAWHAQRHPERQHLLLLDDDAGGKLSYGELLERSRGVADGLRGLDLEPGATVGLMLPSEVDYFLAFLGVQLAGGIPVPLYPPVRPSQLEEHLRRQAGILRNAQAQVLVTVPEVFPLARVVRAQVETLRHLAAVPDLEKAGVGGPLAAARGEDIAFLQYTSGSTGDPKGVVLTHANLLANLRAVGEVVKLEPDDRVVSWLPLYHDMGLIGAWMGSLYYGMPLVLMSPLTFLARPLRWLEAIHRHRGTASASPNFGYELCLKRIGEEELEGLDLSSWRLALNGAEPVSPHTVERFVERFGRCGFRREAMLPVYGLAESSVALTFPPADRGPSIDAVRRDTLGAGGRAEPTDPDDEHALRFVSCGLPLPGHEVRVVDEGGKELPERQQGRLQFRGPSATSGYYRNPIATRRLFDGEWLDSGDLAYIAEGEVFVTGRVKDVIIRAGRNIYPEEVEEAVGRIDRVRKGCVAVFGSTDAESGTERLVVLAETREEDEEAHDTMRREIQDVMVDLLGMPADEVVLAPPHAVLKTSSGKIRRSASRELYEAGEIGKKPPPAVWQVVRLAWSSVVPALGRARRRLGALGYAAWFWLVVGAVTLPVWALLLVVPGLGRRRRLARRIARGVARAVGVPIRVQGLQRFPARGPWVAAANHASYLDPFVLVAALPPDGAYVAKRELVGSVLPRSVLGRLGTVFVERFEAAKSLEDARGAATALGRGQSLVAFPEGTFTRAPGLRAFRLGAFAAAAQAGTPVVPVALRGTRSLLRAGSWIPRRGPVVVHVAEPQAPRGDDWEAAVALRDAVRAKVLERCGEPDLAAELVQPPRPGNV
jgi:acyl carrier protein